MTRDEILAMPAGREMDALVAEKIFGNVKDSWSWRFTLPDYSTDISAAWEVVEKMTDPRLMTREMIEGMSNTRFGYWFDKANLWAYTAQEVALQICRAALLVVMEER